MPWRPAALGQEIAVAPQFPNDPNSLPWLGFPSTYASPDSVNVTAASELWRDV